MAAVLVQGKATISGNTFFGVGAKQGNAVLVWEKAAAIIVKNGPKPTHVYGNTATSAHPKAKVADVQGPTGVVQENEMKPATPDSKK